MKKKKSFAIAVTVLVIAIIIVLANLGINIYYDIAYPKHYSEYVEEYSAKYNLDENLVYAVIKTESGFDPNAVSSDDAYGLMQFIPDTFVWVSTKLGYTQYTHEDLFEPEISIEYGCYLLWYLLDEFKTTEEALAAYHAGRGAVNNWLADEEYSQDNQTLTTTPYKDTNHYIEKVMNNYEVYSEQYTE